MRQRAVLGLASGLGILLVAISTAERASAGFQFCNHMDFTVYAAIGYPDRQQRWVVQGWLRMDPGQCKEALRGNLTTGSYYVHAHGTDGSNKRRTWTGKTPFCINADRQFKLYNSQYGLNSEAECAPAGLRSVNFREVVVRSENYTYPLTPHVPPGPAAGTPSPTPGPQAAPPQAAPAPSQAGPAPRPTAPGGGGGTACQRFPNLC